MGFAPKTRNRVWRKPSMPPIANAEEADGMRLWCPHSVMVVDLSKEADEVCACSSWSDKATQDTDKT